MVEDAFLPSMYSYLKIHTMKTMDSRLRARVAQRGQVTIPKRLRERLGIRPGTVLLFTEQEGRLIAVKEANRDALDDIFGSMGRGRRTQQVLDDLRGGGGS